MKKLEDKFSDYIIAKEGEKPLIVKPEALKKLVKDRNLLGDDLVFCDLQKVWKKARNVQGLRTMFAKLESNLNAIVSNPEVDETFDVIGAIERENLSNQPIRSKKTTPNLIAPIESEPELPDNDRPDLQQPVSLQDAIKHLQSKSTEDEEIDEENASFYSKYCKPKYMAYLGIFIAFYLSGYYLFFSPTYSLPEIKEVIVGNVTIENKTITTGTVTAMADGKTSMGIITSAGNYKITNPPKGDLKFKVTPYAPPADNLVTKGLPKIKGAPYFPPAYNKYENELALNYKGGIKVFDINLKMPVPPPNK
ncbi:MAG: hypothetical protein DWH70_09335 [Planctomycetota bacterium]|nr:MAG: hypothetical protein DWH70_09335 [Planctomycetota bacterium]